MIRKRNLNLIFAGFRMIDELSDIQLSYVHCAKNNQNLRVKTEPVTAGADASVRYTLCNQCWARLWGFCDCDNATTNCTCWFSYYCKCLHVLVLFLPSRAGPVSTANVYMCWFGFYCKCLHMLVMFLL